MGLDVKSRTKERRDARLSSIRSETTSNTTGWWKDRSDIEDPRMRNGMLMMNKGKGGGGGGGRGRGGRGRGRGGKRR